MKRLSSIDRTSIMDKWEELTHLYNDDIVLNVLYSYNTHPLQTRIVNKINLRLNRVKRFSSGNYKIIDSEYYYSSSDLNKTSKLKIPNQLTDKYNKAKEKIKEILTNGQVILDNELENLM